MMVISTDNKICPHDLQVDVKSFSCFMNVKPLFSHDSQHIIIACGSEVRVFSIKSGECVQNLKHHSRPVISMKENKLNILQIFSCSEDGVVVRWDYMVGIALEVYDLQMEIATFHPLKPNNELWLFTKKYEDHFRLYAAWSKKKVGSSIKLIMKPVLPKENTIAYSFMDKFVVSVIDNWMTIYIFDTSDVKRHNYGDRTFKCVACHPSDFVIATGDCHGRVVLWSNVLESNHPIRSIYHWHSLPVSDLAFSPEGSYLHSGGGEAALVKWNLFSEEKTILPRMGAPILHVCASKDNYYVATIHSDNVLQVTDSQRNVVQVIQGLTKSDSQTVGLLYNAYLKALVMNGKPGHLQFYDINQDKQLFNLDISGKNFMSQERETTINNIDVQKAAIDDKGLWLATAEYWRSEDFSPHIWLKFWSFNLEKQMFVLNTNVWLPHNKSVNCILFNPVKHMAVTTSDDGRFKVWELNDNTDGSKPHWSCDAMGYYRDFPAGSACFSEDGSLLAVAFESVATLWSIDGIALKAVLCHDKSKGNIKQLLFGRNACSHYLLCHDSSSLTVWNVLSLSIPWIINTDVQVLAADPLSDNIAVFCQNQSQNHSLIIFKPSNPNPIYRIENVSEIDIVSATFLPSKNVSDEEEYSDDEEEGCFHDNSQLFFLNKNQNLLTLSEKIEDDETSTSKKIVAQASIETPFAVLQAVHKKSDVQKLESEQFTVGKGDNEIFIDNPLLQDPQVLCASILESLLKPLEKKNSDVEIMPSQSKKKDKKKKKEVRMPFSTPNSDVDTLPSRSEEEEVKMPFSTTIPDWMEELKNMKPTFIDFSYLQQTVLFSKPKDES